MQSTDTHSADPIIKLATEILVAFVPNSGVTAEELPALIRNVRLALIEDVASPGASVAAPPAEPVASAPSEAPPAPQLAAAAGRAPAVPVDESVFDDYLISLEDGKRYRSLRRHLMSKYGMTPDQYRQKWGLPSSYPMVSPSYARERSEVAKRIGLGRTPAPVAPVKRVRSKAS